MIEEYSILSKEVENKNNVNSLILKVPQNTFNGPVDDLLGWGQSYTGGNSNFELAMYLCMSLD